MQWRDIAHQALIGNPLQTIPMTRWLIRRVQILGFIGWELRSTHPMLDIRLFRHRGFASVNVTAMLFSFGMFGAIFFLILGFGALAYAGTLG